MTVADQPSLSPTPRERIASARQHGCDDPVKYVDANPLRALLCDMVGLDVGDRFNDDGRVALTKPHLRAIAHALTDETTDEDGEGTDIDALDRKPLLEYVCNQVGSDYSPTAGIQWALTKDNLKAIYYALEHDGETEVER